MLDRQAFARELARTLANYDCGKIAIARAHAHSLIGMLVNLPGMENIQFVSVHHPRQTMDELDPRT